MSGPDSSASRSPSLAAVSTSPVMLIGGRSVAGVEIAAEDSPLFSTAISPMIYTSSTADVLDTSVSSPVQPPGMGPDTSTHLATSSDQLTRDGRPGLGLSMNSLTGSLPLLHPANMSAPYLSAASTTHNSSILNVSATPFLPNCTPSIGILSSTGNPAIPSTSGEQLAEVGRQGPTSSTQAINMPAPYLLGQQLPPISKFSGENLEDEGETFLEWAEQFELIAEMCGWSDQAKLVNLTTRLRGQAYSFYRTCTPKQRSDYKELKAKLVERFTPIRIQAVHSNLFHQRKQESGETVDCYAQDLRRLFYKAYPKASQGSEQAEDLGRSVLAYQFVSGLIPALRTKVAGIEGNFDQLLVKARFEEAKIRDLTLGTNNPRNPRNPPPRPTETPGRMESNPQVPSRNTTGSKQDRKQAGKRCYSCNGTGHFQKNCPSKGRSEPAEVSGMGQTSKKDQMTANLQGDAIQQAQDKVAQLWRDLMAAEREESIAKAAVTTYVLQGDLGTKDMDGNRGPTLGPTLKVKASIEGCPTEALIDTGSPVSLVSIDFLLRALVMTMEDGATQDDITRALRARLEDPELTVRNFGGNEVNIVGQATVTVSCGEHRSRTTVLIQKGTQLELLLGTDILGKLGFKVLQLSGDGTPHDLLSMEVRKQEESTFGILAGGQEPPVTDPVATVRVLKATRIPGRHCQMVRVYTSTDVGMGDWLFNPAELGSEDEWVTGAGATVCVVAPEAAGMMVITVENHNHHPIELEEGQLLGSVEPVSVLSTPPEVRALDLTKPSNHTKDSTSEVLWQLDIETSLEEDYRKDLEAVVNEFTGIFALSPSELGRTDLVQHVINTGDHPPIKQLPHRTPFALRKRTEELIDKMLDEGVIRIQTVLGPAQ